MLFYLPDLGFSIVSIIVVPYFFAAFDRIEITKYVFKGSKSQVGSSRSRITENINFCYTMFINNY